VKILALESATAACSAAVWVDGAVVAAERAEMSRGHAEALLPMVHRVRAASGLAFTAFDRLAVTVGPGHFTGLRVGLAAARGLALATGRPLVGVTTLEAVAAAVPAAQRGGSVVVVALESKRAEPYLQSFDSALAPRDPPCARPVAAYAAGLVANDGPYIVVGDAADRLAIELLRHTARVSVIAALRHPDAAIVAALAAVAPVPAAAPAPLYIHPVETTTPSKAALGVSS
jgi:tRNA threonylcarbamoyladenosine biosynthesis protein TsaB